MATVRQLVSKVGYIRNKNSSWEETMAVDSNAVYIAYWFVNIRKRTYALILKDFNMEEQLA